MITIALTPIPLPPVGFAVTRQQQQQFINDYNILGPPNLDHIQRKRIRVLGLVYELNNKRGVDYRTNGAQLVSDAYAYTGGISNFDLQTAMAAVDWSNGYAADPSIGTDVNNILTTARPRFTQRSEDELDRIILMLRVRLGQ